MQRKHEDRKLSIMAPVSLIQTPDPSVLHRAGGALESSLLKQQNLSSQSRNLLLQPWESHLQTTTGLSRELVMADTERMVQVVSLLLLYKNVGQ